MVYGPSPGPYSVTLKATAKVPDTIGAETLADFKQRVRAVMEKRTQYILGKLREASTRGPVFARTGTLARSWTAYPVRETEDGLTAGFFSRVPYAAIQETGGKITAKGKALTIPMGQNTEGVTTARFPTVALLKSRFGADNVFTLKLMGGTQALIMAKTGKTSKSAKAFFILKKSVTIKAKGYVSKVKAEAEPLMASDISKAMGGG